MLENLGPEGRALWPCAVQHACWSTRQGAKRRKKAIKKLEKRRRKLCAEVFNIDNEIQELNETDPIHL